MIVDQIYKYINKEGKEINNEILKEASKRFDKTITKQFMSDDNWDRTGKIYPSTMGKKCARQLAYRYLGFKYESDMAPRTKIKFFLGDLSELGTLALAKLSGLDIGLSQSKLDIEVEGHKTHGYIDGLLYDDGEPYVVEAKSKGKWGFQTFKRDGFKDTPTYMTQINLYMRNLGIDKGIFLVINTDTGHIAEQIVHYDEKYIKIAQDNVKTVLNSTKENLPKRLHKITDFKWMPRNKCYEINDWRCDYCDYNNKCWGNITVDTVGGKPKHRIYMDDYDDLPGDVQDQITIDKV